MYLDNGELDTQYLLENDLTDDEFEEAAVRLIDNAYRKVTEWRMSVRSERPVDEVDQLAEEAGKTAYILDRVTSDFYDAYRNLGDRQLDLVNKGRRAWRFVNESGTQMQYTGKDPEELEEGDFVLVNGNNVDPFAEEHEELDTYTLPETYISKYSGPFRISSIEVDTEASLDDLPEDDIIRL